MTTDQTIDRAEPAVTLPVAPDPKGAPTRGRLRAALRRAFTRSPQHRDRPAQGVASPDRKPIAVASPATLDSIDWKRWYPALMTFAAGVVVVTFAMSYHGLFEFALKIAHMPWGLAVAAPLGVDVFSLCCLASTFLLRAAPWRVRLYSWAMFSATVTISIAGNAVYAIYDLKQRDAVATWGLTQHSAVVGTAIWPVFAAGALHLLIIGRRHLERQRDIARQQQAEEELRAVEAQQAEDTETVLKGRAIVAAADGATVSDILTDLDLTEDQRRNVERWTKKVRDALAAPKPAIAASTATRRVTTARADRKDVQQ